MRSTARTEQRGEQSEDMDESLGSDPFSDPFDVDESVAQEYVRPRRRRGGLVAVVFALCAASGALGYALSGVPPFSRSTDEPPNGSLPDGSLPGPTETPQEPGLAAAPSAEGTGETAPAAGSSALGSASATAVEPRAVPPAPVTAVVADQEPFDATQNSTVGLPPPAGLPHAIAGAGIHFSLILAGAKVPGAGVSMAVVATPALPPPPIPARVPELVRGSWVAASARALLYQGRLEEAGNTAERARAILYPDSVPESWTLAGTIEHAGVLAEHARTALEEIRCREARRHITELEPLAPVLGADLRSRLPACVQESELRQGLPPRELE